MNNSFNTSSKFSHKIRSKDTNVFCFLKAVPNIKYISVGLILKLSQRFCITPDTMALLIHAAANGGGYYEN